MTQPFYRVRFMPGAGPYDIPGDYYLNVPTGSGGGASTPDAASLDIVGDIHVRVEVTLDDWSTSGPTRTFAAKYGAAGQRSWWFGVIPTGQIFFVWSTDGTATATRYSAVPLASNTGRLAVGVKLDVSNAGNNVITFETAASMGGTWADLASETASGTTSIFNSTASVIVGNTTAGSVPLDGRCHKVEVRDGIGGTVVANPNFTAQTPGTTGFTDTATPAKTWTVNSPATIAGFDWVNIPANRVRSMNWDDGRDNELDQFRPSTATIALKNNDRLFDPEHTSGTYYGKLNPRVPFNIQLSTDNSTWIDQFYGFVRDGWAQSYVKPKVSTCTVGLEDLLGVLESEPLPRTAYELAVRADNARAYWTLDERSGIQMADSSGNGFHGLIDNGELGADPLIFGDGSAFFAPHVGDNRGIFKGEGLPVGPPCTLSAWIKTPRDAAAAKVILNVQRDSARGVFVSLEIPTSATAPNGELAILFGGLGGGYKARGHVRVDDDVRHHVVCTIAGTAAADVKLYVDGVEQTKTTISGTTPGTWVGLLWWTVANTANLNVGDFGLDGVIDEVAIFDLALSASQVQAQYLAGATANDGDLSGVRLRRVLSFLGVPASLTDIADGDTTVGPADYAGQAAGSYMQRVVESEQGVLFVDHHNGGKLKFRGRYARLTETRSTTSQTTFTPVHYREDVAPEPNGIATVVNVAEVTWQGGKETVIDAASRKRFGAQSRSLNTEAATAVVAQSAGQWLIARYKNPQVRLRDLPINLAGKPALWSKILDLRISDRITVQRHPQAVGTAISNQLIIEGARISLNPDKSWTADYRLSNADDTQVWIWATGAWGTTTVWG